MANDIIRKITVLAEESGLDNLTKKLKTLETAQGRVAIAAEQWADAEGEAARKGRSALETFQGLERRLVGYARDLANVEKAVNAAYRVIAQEKITDPSRAQAVVTAAIERTTIYKEHVEGLIQANERLAQSEREAQQARVTAIARRHSPFDTHVGAFRQDQERRALQAVEEAAKIDRVLEQTHKKQLQREIEYAALEERQFQRALKEMEDREKADAQLTQQRLADEALVDRYREIYAKKQIQREIEAAEVEERQFQRELKQMEEQERERAALRQQMEKEANDLRSKIDPVTHAHGIKEKEVERYKELLDADIINRTEYVRAVEHAQSKYDRVARNYGNDATANKLKLAAGEWQNLSFQVNDAVTMLLSGSSVFQVVATQGGQVYQSLAAADGGVKGGIQAVIEAAKGFPRWIMSMVTPLRLLGVTAIATAAAVTKAWWDYSSGQEELSKSLRGMGRGSGATVSGMNITAREIAEANSISIQSARSIQAAFAATGRIHASLFAEMGRTTKRFADYTGLTMDEAAKELAKAFSDPAKGAEDLQEKIGLIDSRTKRYIQTLVNQNERQRAIQVLNEAVIEGVGRQEKHVSQLGKAWNYVWNQAKMLYDTVGRGVDIALGGGTNEELLERAQRELDNLRKQRQAFGGAMAWMPGIDAVTQQSERELLKRIDELKEKIQKGAADAADQLNKELGEKGEAIIRGLLSDLDRLQGARDQLKILEDLQANPEAMEKMGVGADALAEALQRARSAVDNFKTAADRLIETHRLELQAIDAETLAERANLEAERARIDAINDGRNALEESLAAEAARNRVIAEANRNARDALRDAERQQRLFGLKPYQRALEMQRQREEDFRRENTLGSGVLQTPVRPISPTVPGALRLGAGETIHGRATAEQMQRIVAGTAKAAQDLGVSAKDLLTIISYETAGTFNPRKPGQITKYGRHEGLIQWGQPQQRDHGITDLGNIEQQTAAMVSYFRRAGVRPGMGIMDLYSAVNAGYVGRTGWSDKKAGGAPGTVADKVNYQMGGHAAAAQAALARFGSNQPIPVVLAGPQSQRLDRIPQTPLPQTTQTMPEVGVTADEDAARAAAIQRSLIEREFAEGPLKQANEGLSEQNRLLQAQWQTLGMSTFEVTKAAEAQRLYNEYLRSGYEPTQAIARDIDEYATKAAHAAVEVERLAAAQEALQEFEGIAKDALKGFISDLRAGKSGAEALENVMNRIADKLIDMAINSIFDSKGGGLLSIVGSLLGGGGKGVGATVLHQGGWVGVNGTMRYVHPAYFENAPRFHSGTLRSDERAAILQTGERVLSRDDVAALRQSSGKQQAQPTVVQPVVNVINAPTQPEVRTNEDGSIDLVFEQFENWQADRAKRGRGPLVKAVSARQSGTGLIG